MKNFTLKIYFNKNLHRIYQYQFYSKRTQLAQLGKPTQLGVLAKTSTTSKTATTSKTRQLDVVV